MNDDDARRRAASFVREVEAAMVGLPRRRRAELTAGLVEHLLEPSDDGLLLIDQGLDPRSYAEDLRASAPPTDDQQRTRRAPLVAGAALLTLVVAAGAWTGIVQPWRRDPQPTPTASAWPDPAQTLVPDVRGLPRAEALSALESVNLSTQVLDLPEGEPGPWVTSLASGTVAVTDPFPGTLVDAGSLVILMVTP